jgi:hypothetical protein
MRKLQSNYPNGEFLIRVFDASEKKLPAFIAYLGYKNIQKGIKRFNHCLQTGEVEPVFQARLISKLDENQREVLNGAMEVTEIIIEREANERRIKEEQEERRRFVPVLHPIAELEKSPSITMFGLSGGYSKYIEPLPTDIPSWAVDRQRTFLKQLIIENYAKHEGQIRLLGPISHYLFACRYKEPLQQFSITGDFVGEKKSSGFPICGVGLR